MESNMSKNFRMDHLLRDSQRGNIISIVAGNGIGIHAAHKQYNTSTACHATVLQKPTADDGRHGSIFSTTAATKSANGTVPAVDDTIYASSRGKDREKLAMGDST
jgi:hypothetical protein